MRGLDVTEGHAGPTSDERLREERQASESQPRSAQGNPTILGDDLRCSKSSLSHTPFVRQEM